MEFSVILWKRVEYKQILWIIGKKTKLPQNIINILIKNYENISCDMAGRAQSSESPE